MPKRLKPQKINPTISTTGLWSIAKSNTLATLNDQGEFSFLQFDETGIKSCDSIVSEFPPYPGTCIGSSGNWLWQIRGRGLYLLNVKNCETYHVIVSNDTEARIVDVCVIDSEMSLFLIVVDPCEPPYKYYLLYNANEDSLFYESPLLPADIFPVNSEYLLICRFMDPGVKWTVVDFSGREISGNLLAEKLTKTQLICESAAVHPQSNRMIGQIPALSQFCSVTWNQDFEEVSITPLLVQIPPKADLAYDFLFSADGAWSKTTLIRPEGFLNVPEIIIYNVGDSYPQGLSFPIYCGYTKELNPGAFMNHNTWGACYLEQDFDNKKFFLYQLNDGLKILAGQLIYK